MPRLVHSLAGRVVLLGSLVVTAALFSAWFLSKDRLLGRSQRTTSHRAIVEQRSLPRKRSSPAPVASYPSLGDSGTDAGLAYGAEPDYDPLGAPRAAARHPLTPLDLLRLVPSSYSVLGLLNITELRKYAWARSILRRRRLPRLRRYLDKLGLDPTRTNHVAFGVDLETRPATSRTAGDPGFLDGHYDRPFCLIASGKTERRSLLRRFRQPGPLAATMLMGRRVYRRSGDYGLSFPAREIAMWSYRAPMGPMLRLLLENGSHGGLNQARRELLRQGGLSLDPPAPLALLAWTAQPHRRAPWPFSRLGGGAPLRGAVLVLRPDGSDIIAKLRLLCTSQSAALRGATLLRYVRRTVSKRKLLRGTMLKPVITALPVVVEGSTIRMEVRVRPWHARALMAVLHRLIEK